MVHAAERSRGGRRSASGAARLALAFLLIVFSVSTLAMSPARAITDAEVDIALTADDNGAGGVDLSYAITNLSPSEDLTILIYDFTYGGTAYSMGDFNCASDDIFANGGMQTCEFTIEDVGCAGNIAALKLRVNSSGGQTRAFELPTTEVVCGGAGATPTTTSPTGATPTTAPALDPIVGAQPFIGVFGENNCENLAPDETETGSYDIIKTTSTPVVLNGGFAEFVIEIGNHTGDPIVVGQLSDCLGGSERNLLDGSGLVCTSDDGVLEIGPQTIASGDELICNYSQQVFGTPGEEIANVASTSIFPEGTTAPTGDALAFLQDEATVTIGQSGPVTLSVEKTDNGASVQEPGDLVTYDLTITNLSNRRVTITELTDQSDDGGTPFNIDGIAGSDCTTGRRLSASGTQGDSFTCSFTAFVGGDAGELIGDTVTVLAIDEAGVEGIGEGSDTTPVIDVLPDVTVGVTDDGAASSAPSADVTFTVTISNNGREEVSLTSVVADIGNNTDVDLTTVGSVVSATSFEPGTAVAGFGGSYVFTYDAAVAGAEGDSVTTSLRVAASDDDANTGRATATETTPVAGGGVAPPVDMVDLRLSKTAPGSYTAGDDVTYTLEVTNNGTTTATKVAVIDTLPPSTSFIRASGDGWSCAPAGGEVRCDGADLAAGQSSTVRLTLNIATTASTGMLINNAVVESGEQEATAADNVAVASNGLTAVAAVTVQAPTTTARPTTTAPPSTTAPTTAAPPVTAPPATVTTQATAPPSTAASATTPTTVASAPVVNNSRLPITGSNSDLILGYGALIAAAGLLVQSMMSTYRQQVQGAAMFLPVESGVRTPRYRTGAVMRAVSAFGRFAGRSRLD